MTFCYSFIQHITITISRWGLKGSILVLNFLTKFFYIILHYGKVVLHRLTQIMIQRIIVYKWPWFLTLMSFWSAMVNASIPGSTMSWRWIVEKLLAFLIELYKLSVAITTRRGHPPLSIEKIEKPLKEQKTLVKLSNLYLKWF